MPLVKPNHDKDEKISWRIRLEKSVCDEITQYCEWSGIRYRDYFIQEACKYKFENDPKWIKHKKNTLKTKK